MQHALSNKQENPFSFTNTLWVFIIVAALLGVAWFMSSAQPVQTVEAIYVHQAAGVSTAVQSDIASAQTCIKNNGTKAVLSEWSTGDLHWLCVDKNGNIWDLITKMLTKTVKNPDGETEIVTAYKPTNLNPGNGQVVLEDYIKELTTARAGEVAPFAKLVNLFMRVGGLGVRFGP